MCFFSKRLLCAIVCLLSSSTHAEDFHWALPQFGFWSSSELWSLNGIPSQVDDVYFAHTTPYTVVIVSDQAAGSVAITDRLVSLELLGSSSLSLFGDLTNEGVLRINPKEADESAAIHIKNNVVIYGNGLIRLEGGPTKSILSIDGMSHLTNGTGHIIEGAGAIRGTFINNGVVRSTNAGSTFLIGGDDVQNTGYMSAQSSSLLLFNDAEIQQSKSGLLEAVGPGSRIVFNNSVLEGGRVNTNGGGEVGGGSSRFEQVRFGRDVLFTPTDTLVLKNTSIEGGSLTLRCPEFSSVTLLISESIDFLTTTEINLGGDESGDVSFYLANESQYQGEFLVRGNGSFTGPFVNTLGVYADQYKKRLYLDASSYPSGSRNTAVMKAEQGGVLEIQGWVVQSQDAEIVSDGSTSEVYLNGIFIGGAIRSVDGGKFKTSDGFYLVDVELEIDIDTEDQQLSLEGAITNNGNIFSNEINCTDVNIRGNGFINIVGGILKTGSVTSDKQVVNSQFHTIRGDGAIQGHVLNFGRIESSVHGGELELTTNILENHGIVQSLQGATLVIKKSVIQSDSGILQASGTNSIVIIGGFGSQGSLYIYGGELNGIDGGRFVVESEAVLESITLNAELELRTAGALITVGDGFINNGVININPEDAFFGSGIQFETTNALEGNGVVRLSDPMHRSFIYAPLNVGPVRVGVDQRIEGWGDIQASLQLAGTIAPGLPVGAMKISNRLEVLPEGCMEIQVSAEDEDRIDSSDEVLLGGLLRVDFVGNYIPDGYWARRVIVGTNITGTFSELEFPKPPQGLVDRVYNSGTDVYIGQTCVSDYTVDGQIDFFDVSLFLEFFSDQSPDADLNFDGQLDFFDVSLFLEGVMDGCG